MTVKPQNRKRRPKVAGHNRPRPAQALPATPAEEPVVDESPAADSVAEDSVAGDAADPGVRRSRSPLVLVLVAAVLTGLGVFFVAQSSSGPAGGVDTKSMTEVNGQVKDALEKVFSFSYDKVDESAAAAREVLAGQAIGEYDKLVEQVRAQAPAQKLVLATKVTTTGVKTLDGDQAELLVFLDQVATRVDTGRTSGSAAALSVTAQRQDGKWRITGMVPR